MWSLLPAVLMMVGEGVDPLRLTCGQKRNVAFVDGVLPTQSFTSRSFVSARTKILRITSSTWSRSGLAVATGIVCGCGGSGAFGGVGFGFLGVSLFFANTDPPNPWELANTTA